MHCFKPAYVSVRENFVTDRLSSVALREIRREFSKKPVVFAVLGAGLILGLSGPFGTFEEMGTMLRIAYWSAIAVGTFVIGVGVGACLYQLLHSKGQILRIVCASICAGVVISLFLVAFNWAFLGRLPSSIPSFLRFLGEVMFIAAIITTGIDLSRSAAAEEGSATEVPPLLERLAFEKRGALVSLSATDHYVDIVTKNGQEMILMRLGDAIREVGSTKGVQVHRSHWVALDQVVSVERQGDGAQLTMSGGGVIPVSRSRMPAIREAGLLPKR